MARFPPSMGIRAPVIQLDASDASNTASPLMSSGSPIRPRGRPLRNRSRKRGIVCHAPLQARVDDLGRQDRIDPHAAARPFGAELARHLDDRAHRHDIGDMAAPHRGDAGDGADIDDAAAAGRQHPAARLLAGTEAAEDDVAPGLLHRFQRNVLPVAPDTASPATLPRKSIRPKSRSSWVNMRRIWSGWETSHVTATARRPSFSISAAVFSTPARLRPASIRSAPASARPMAMARPMPLAAPDTRATRPERSNRAAGIDLQTPGRLMDDCWPCGSWPAPSP